VRWASYLVLAIWAIWLTQQEDADTMALVLATTWFFGTLAIIEALFGVDVSAFDFATSFGLIMMLGVLAGTLSSGSRLVWSVAAGATAGVWSITMGLLRGDATEVIAVRAVISLAGVVFTTALVSKLYDQLSESITRYEKATRLQNAIATSSEALLVQTDAFAIYEALRALLDATEADYAYVDRNTEQDGAIHWEIIADATRKASLPSGGWKSGVYLESSTVFRGLRDRRAVTVRTKDLKGEERAAYERDGIVTEASVPIFVGDVFRGAIGFVQYTGERQWTEDEIATLWRASHMIGAYWRRQDDQEQLKASNESKDRLLASVSHEIRTPLTAIVGLSEEIVSSRTSLGGEELDELNGIIAVQSRELAELVEDLLVASRAEFGNLSIKPGRIDLREEVDSVVRGVTESHPTHKAIAVAGSGIFAWADPLRCRQIIRNLLTNAIRYGGDRIAVMVQEQAGRAQILVADDGDGVKPAEAELIFERYYRSQQSPTQPGSVGIGLAVSRQLAEMMDGTLRYVGTSEESRFELLLPSAPLPATDGLVLGTKSARPV
jgi:signal transduction histidine kinase